MQRFSKPILFVTALACLAMLAVGLYLQLVLDMLPCPLCILQRYAFVAVALACLVTVALPSAATRLGAAAACVAAVTGAGIAIRHLWVKAHPEISCGIDPLETSLNKVFIADWIPALFQAAGLCTTEYDPILGLSIPHWALAWFTVFALVTAALALRKRHSA